jgi:hypothetical protein
MKIVIKMSRRTVSTDEKEKTVSRKGAGGAKEDRKDVECYLLPALLFTFTFLQARRLTISC